MINKIGRAIESNGGVVVCMDDCSGERTAAMMIDPDAPDILRAIADRYLDINCSVMTPNDGRMENTLTMCEKYHVDGVVESVLQACHTFNVESARMQEAVEGAGIPYMKIETDYSNGDHGPDRDSHRRLHRNPLASSGTGSWSSNRRLRTQSTLRSSFGAISGT